MFAEFRSEVIATIAAGVPDCPLWPEVPEDVAEVPCVVVGRSGGRETATAVVFDLTLVVYVIGRRQTAGQAEDELTALADQVFEVLGGTRGTKGPNGLSIGVTRVDPRSLIIAGVECPAFTVEVETSATTC